MVVAPAPAPGPANQDASETETVNAFCQFLVQHYGSVLRAWRFGFDPLGDGELLYAEFIAAVASMPPWRGDVTVLWTALMRRARANARVDDVVLRLRELSAEDYQCLEDFRRWADTAFGGALEVFKAATDGRPNALITFFEFEEACRSNGFGGDCHKIFHECLCPEGAEKGASSRDFAYLETKAIKRKEAMDPAFVLQQSAARATAKRLRERNGRLQRAKAEALQEFLAKVRKAHGGSLIRGWRRVLDTNGNLAICKTELLKGCLKIAYSGDVVALWRSLDTDDDGIVMLEEVDCQLALVLAGFKKWASEVNGSCVATLVQLGCLTKRQSHKWDLEGLLGALKQANFPRVSQTTTIKQAATMLYEALDVESMGFFTAQDVAFLDKWSPTPWLVADPDEEERKRFIKILRSRYPNLIVAWRKLLDRDNSNKVSYKTFLEACQKLKMPNPPGLWRALDDDASGCISLNEIDQEAADTLLNFKRWAESVFGTLPHMFHVFDVSKIGKVSFPVFRRALRNFGFEGDASVLFQSLKPCAKKSNKSNHRHELTLQDLLYLSTWECEGDEEKPKPSGSRTSRSRKSILARPSAPSPQPPESAEPHPPESGTSAAKPVNDREVMAYCRSKEDYQAYLQAGNRQKLLDAYGKKHNEKQLDSIDQARHKLPQLIPSPFLAPAVAPLPVIAGSGRKMPRSGAKSTGQLQHLPKVSPNGEQSLERIPVGGGDIADRIMANRARRLQETASLPLL